MQLGIDPDVMFAKDRAMRAMITGGVVADRALNNLRNYDAEQKREAERKRKR